MNEVTDKVAIVTGGGSGIGRATSKLLATAGASVVVTDINEEAAAETVSEITLSGGRALPMCQDVVDESRWQEVVEAATGSFGTLSILVNNAGMSGAGLDTHSGNFADWRKIMEVNLDSVFLGCRVAIDAMRVEGGSIINISSIYGIIGGAGPAYSASKGGVRLLTKSVAAHCGAQGLNIRVNSIHPGYIWTPMVRSMVQGDSDAQAQLYENLVQKHPIGRLGEAEDVARAVLFLASNDASFITGSELVIDGGFTAV